MNVKEFRNYLKRFNENDEVYIAIDPEMNAIYRLYEIEEYMVTPENEIKIRELTPELEEMGFEDGDIGSIKNGDEFAIVLLP